MNDKRCSVVLRNRNLLAEVSSHGAELVRLQDEDGRDLLWDGSPDWWTGRAPLLFPVVGKLPNDTALIDGRKFPMRQHGFARTKNFSLVERTDSECRFQLKADEETQAQYPFNFLLDIYFSITAATLRIVASVISRSSRAMPFSFGFHPAFRWPQPYGGGREEHEIRFESTERTFIRRTIDGLLDTHSPSAQFNGRGMRFDDKMFEAGAMIFDQLDSRTVDFGVAGKRSIRVKFAGMPHLGIWTRPGAGFLCIEPWQGYAAPIDFAGELQTKPGIHVLPPGDRATFTMEIFLLAADQATHDRR